jgi:hypothetical protein
LSSVCLLEGAELLEAGSLLSSGCLLEGAGLLEADWLSLPSILAIQRLPFTRVFHVNFAYNSVKVYRILYSFLYLAL